MGHNNSKGDDGSENSAAGDINKVNGVKRNDCSATKGTARNDMSATGLTVRVRSN